MVTAAKLLAPGPGRGALTPSTTSTTAPDNLDVAMGPPLSLPRRGSKRPSPRLGPTSVPSHEALQFPMDLDDTSSPSALAPPSAPHAPHALEQQQTWAGPPPASASASAAAAHRRSGQTRRVAMETDNGDRDQKKPRRSKTGSRTGSHASSVGASPTLSASASTALAPLPPVEKIDGDGDEATTMRSHEFQTGRRVFHVHFGHGYVTSLETAPPEKAGDGTEADVAPAKRER